MLRAGLKFLIKDALRGARYTMRQSTQVDPPLDFPGRAQLTRIADSVLTSLEETVVNLRYGSDLADEMIRAALADYGALAEAIGQPDFENRFSSINYRLSRGLLSLRGLDTIYISELAYAGAARRITLRARRGAASLAHADLAAEISMALIDAAPIKGVPRTGAVGDVFRSDTNVACAFALGLTVTAWLTKGEGLNAVDCATSASEFVTVVFDRLDACRHSTDPVAALASVFRELAVFVP